MFAAFRGHLGYDLVLLLHIVTVIVGFGGVIFNNVYDIRSAATDPGDDLAVTGATLHVFGLAEKVLYLVPVFGIWLVIMNDSFSFSDAWISASFVIYIVAIGLLHGLIFPSHRNLVSLLKAASGGDVDAGAITRSRTRLRIGNSALNALLVVAVYLMIWGPTSG